MLRRLLKIFIFSFLFLFVSGLCCFYLIETTSKKFLYENLDDLPVCKSGLVLGTAQHLKNGANNLYFFYRMDAAEKLFKARKVSCLILSGDNRVRDYNEPKAMQKELLKRGIPDSCLVLDHAGLRTFDSMVRCKEIFGQDSVIVISQAFHNARAIYISQHIGLVSFGYNAREVTTQNELKIKIREFFSRIKCVLDIYLLNTKPRHLGEKIKIG